MEPGSEKPTTVKIVNIKLAQKGLELIKENLIFNDLDFETVKDVIEALYLIEAVVINLEVCQLLLQKIAKQNESE